MSQFLKRGRGQSGNVMLARRLMLNVKICCKSLCNYMHIFVKCPSGEERHSAVPLLWEEQKKRYSTGVSPAHSFSLIMTPPTWDQRALTLKYPSWRLSSSLHSFVSLINVLVSLFFFPSQTWTRLFHLSSLGANSIMPTAGKRQL